MCNYTIGPFFFFIVFLGQTSCVFETVMIGDQSELSYQRKNWVTWALRLIKSVKTACFSTALA